ncbi:MAG: PilT/PilU family type 4a pilus ATPase [Candidatus Wallbacteria bacterium]|nr:PilT/PilU family type 4a pilus ATPase [Candidatus Wallbacteria bacterium]
MSVKDMLQDMVSKGATDIIFSTGSAPAGRFGGRLLPYNQDKFPAELLNKMVFDVMMNEEQRTRFEMTGEMDLTVNLAGVGRFRANVYRQRGELAVAFRTIMSRIPSLTELELPESVRRLLDFPDGLILVAGPSDSGRTTTVASMLDHVNNTRECHIVTVEDPVEFIHTTRKSLISQRELGRDTASYASALKVILKQAPDVVFIDEMPDLETIVGVLKLAETGHLVITTVPARTSGQAVDRLINLFPPYQQQQIRTQLAMTLRGVIAQQLLPGVSDAQRVAAREVLIAAPPIVSLIQEGKTHLIPNVVAQGGALGMIAMDEHLRQLAEAGRIAPRVAMARATDSAKMVDAQRGQADLANLEKALYDPSADRRKAAELELQKLASTGNKGASEILEQFARFYQTNFDDKKIGVRR